MHSGEAEHKHVSTVWALFVGSETHKPQLNGCRFCANLAVVGTHVGAGVLVAMMIKPRDVAAFLILSGCGLAQIGTPGRIENGFDAMLKGNGVMDIHTLEELDENRKHRIGTPSEANVSLLDLKAPGRARREYSKGLLFLSKNNYQQAEESLKNAVKIYPQFVSAHNALGCAYFGLKKNEEARQEFAESIRLDDHLSSSHMNLGRVLLAMGQVSEAQASMEKAASLAPQDLNLILALTYAQYLNHDYAAAIRTAANAHSHKDAGIASIHYFAAASWQAQKHLPEAREQLEIFLQEDPKSPFADQAQRVITEIAKAEREPVRLASSTPVFSSTSPDKSVLGSKVLQDLKEKQQIADAEKAEETCASCIAKGPSGPPEAALKPTLRTAVRDPKYGTWTLRSTVDEVSMFFTVTDHGRSVNDLRQNEMRILDNKKAPENVLGFKTESELPLRLALIIDTSASITDRFAFELAAASDFLKQVLTGKEDLAFVAGFSNSIVLTQDFTNDIDKLSTGVRKLAPVGGTSIWDAVSFASEKLKQRQETQPVARVIVVISDGDDNSSNSTLRDALEQVEHDEVCVYSVSTRYADSENQVEATGNRAMRTVAELSGGKAFYPGSASHLSRSLTELQQVIRSRYLVSYRPAVFRHDGGFRSIDITAQRSGRKFKVNARKGYYTEMAATAR